jgi:hypothetical protein
MEGIKTDNSGETPANAPRVVVSSRPMEMTVGAAAVPATRSSASPYVTQALPISLAKPAVPPWARELTRLLDRRAGSREQLSNLRSVERILRMRGAELADLPDDVVRAAGVELRWLARRDAPSRALARLLDQFEHELLQPALRRLQQSRTTAGR